MSSNALESKASVFTWERGTGVFDAGDEYFLYSTVGITSDQFSAHKQFGDEICDFFEKSQIWAASVGKITEKFTASKFPQSATCNLLP
jgi:hypothetical protein